jgi:hypothetical protein
VLAKVQRADAGQATSPHARRVRPVDPEARSLLTDARNRSATVRTLLARLEASDVIVYVQRGLFDRIEIEGRTSLIVTVPEARFVRVIVRSGLSADRGVEMLGHELRHAYEIATALGVRSERDLQQHFATIGFECATGRLETDAARETERSIRRELELERRLVQRGRTR